MRRHAFGPLGLARFAALLFVATVVLVPAWADDVKQAEPEPVVEKKVAEKEKRDDEPADEKADEGEMKRPANPLGRIFGRIFERNGERILPEEKEDIEGALDRRDRYRDYMDRRAPENRKLTDALRTAEKLLKEGQVEKSHQHLLAILGLRNPELDPPEDSLVRADDGQWTSIRWEANRLLGRLPEELLDAHRLEHGAEGEARLEEARRNADLAGVADVAMRYFHTDAGFEAANTLAALHVERGEHGLAARWFGRLLDAEAPGTDNPAWRLKASVAFRRSAQPEKAAELIQGMQDDPAVAALRIGGRPLDLGPWLASIDAENRFGTIPSLDDWPVPYGTAQRIGRHAGDRPLLVPRWQVVDAAVEDSSRRIGGQLEALMLDLRDSGRPAIPSIQPIAVGGRIAYRTLGGVNVVDAETGRKLWETDRGISPLVLLGAEAADGTTGVQSHISGYTGNNPDGHPLTNLLVRNGLWGTVSSDGKRLFVIEDQALMFPIQQYYGWGRQQNNGVRTIGTKTLEFSVNRIAAYDLETGRPVWNVGGPRNDEPFAPSLAGMYFFGPPVAEGGELYAVGERLGDRNDAIRLVSIDPATGGENWSQLIALSDLDIDQDGARRTFSAQVAVGEGIIVCPTTVGWLVAVDRLNHTVLWAQRYTDAPRETSVPENFNEDRNATPYQQLGARWAPSAPIIVGNRVLYAPEEEAALYCFDLFDGHELWEKLMQGHLYVAGVHDGKALLVGRDQIEAVSLDDGRRIWAVSVRNPDVVAGAEPLAPKPRPGVPPMPVPMDHEHAHDHSDDLFPAGSRTNRLMPSGRGVIVGERLYVPMTNGEVWELDLAAGRLASRFHTNDGDRPLGNLVVHRDGLYSASAFGLRAFEPRTRFEQAIADAGDRDPATSLKHAELHFLNRRYDEALEVLRANELEDVPADIRERYRRALVRALVAVVRTSPDSRVDVEQLGAIARSEEEKLEFRRIVAARFEALGRFDDAFRDYLALADDTDFDRPYDAGGDLNVRSGNWLAGRLADVWNRLDDDVRRGLDPEITKRATAALAGSREDRERFAGTFAFHPSALAVERALVREMAPAASFGVVEHRLRRRLLDSGDETTVEAGRALLEELQGELGLDDQPIEPPDWGEVDVRLVQTRDYNSGEMTIPVHLPPSRSPFLRAHRFVLHQQQNHFSGGQIIRLEMTSAADGKRQWMPVLRADQNNGENNARAWTAGNLVILSFRDVVTALSPIDRRIVWSRRLGNRSQLSSFYRNTVRQGTIGVTMQSGSRIVTTDGVIARAGHGGLVAEANGDYVCLHGRRLIRVHDTATGALRWELGNLPNGTTVYGNEEFLVVQRPNGAPVLHRPNDGRVLERSNVTQLAQRALSFDGRGAVVVETRATGILLTSVKTIVRRRDYAAAEDTWSVEYGRNTTFLRLDDDTLLATDMEGTITRLDLSTGERTTLGSIPAEVLRNRGRVHVLADEQRIYAFVEHASGSREHVMTDDNIPNIRFNGTVVTIDRAKGEVAWTREVPNQSLLLPHFNDSPFVLFASRRYQNRPNFSFWMASRLVLDKRTGRVLHDDTVASNNGYQAVLIDIGRRTVELRAYDGRAIFQAVPRKAGGDDAKEDDSDVPTETGDGTADNRPAVEAADTPAESPEQPAVPDPEPPAAVPVPAPAPPPEPEIIRQLDEIIRKAEQAE